MSDIVPAGELMSRFGMEPGESGVRLDDMAYTATAELSPDKLEEYRKELTGYCYRMLGSGFEADDAVQETMLRAWRAADGFEGRSSVRSWLYRIATNICLDMLRGRQRRALPMDLGPSSPPVEALLGDRQTEDIWVSPIADSRVLPEHGDPAHGPASVRHRAPASARPAAGRAHHVRGAQDAGRGGRRGAGHVGARRQQRAAAGPCHAG
jgi:DNA-directed RNA polymerase specialized sigma24 family protein